MLPQARCADGETDTQKGQGLALSQASGGAGARPEVRAQVFTPRCVKQLPAQPVPFPLPPSEYTQAPVPRPCRTPEPPLWALTEGEQGDPGHGAYPRITREGRECGGRRGDTGLVTSEPGARGGAEARGGGKSNRLGRTFARGSHPGPAPPRDPRAKFPAKFPRPRRLVGGGAVP